MCISTSSGASSSTAVGAKCSQNSNCLYNICTDGVCTEPPMTCHTSVAGSRLLIVLIFPFSNPLFRLLAGWLAVWPYLLYRPEFLELMPCLSVFNQKQFVPETGHANSKIHLETLLSLALHSTRHVLLHALATMAMEEWTALWTQQRLLQETP